jgi:hypothetical protein
MTAPDPPPEQKPVDPPDLRAVRARMRELWATLERLLAARRELER